MPGERREQTLTSDKSITTVFRPLHDEAEAYEIYFAILKCVSCCYSQVATLYKKRNGQA